MYNPLGLDKTPPPYLFPVQLPHGHTACDWYVAARLGLSDASLSWIHTNSKRVYSPVKGDIAVFTHRKTRREMGAFIPSSFHSATDAPTPIPAELDVDFHLAVVENIVGDTIYFSDVTYSRMVTEDFMEIAVRKVNDLSTLVQAAVEYYRPFRNDAVICTPNVALYHLVVTTEDWGRVGGSIIDAYQHNRSCPLFTSVKAMYNQMSARFYSFKVKGGVIDMHAVHFMNGGLLTHLVDLWIKSDNVKAPVLTVPEWLSSLLDDNTLIPYYGSTRLPYVINYQD